MDSSAKETEKAFLWTYLLGNPFFSSLTVFTLILIKEVNVSSLQFALAFMLKPACSLLSPYWSALIHRRQDLLKKNLILANVIRYLPFLFFPFYQNTWICILSIAIYWIMTKGMKPAWMECIKLTVPIGKQKEVCSRGLKVGYCGNIVFSILIGVVLDIQCIRWQWLFSITALIGLGSTLFMRRLSTISPSNLSPSKSSLMHVIARPWCDVFKLLSSNRSFLHFQLGFFCAGTGLVLFYPAVSQFLAKDLALSYTVINSASMMVKGIGFLLASPFWMRRFNRFSLLKIGRLVMLLSLAFPCFLFFGHMSIFFIYLAYLLYGSMQAGSELIWHMSGPIYAKQQSSSVYSSTNLFTVGLRGALFPLLGTYLMDMTSPLITIACGSGVILAGIVLVTFFMRTEKETSKVTEEVIT